MGLIVVVVLILAACGSSDTASGTHLDVDGVATTATAIVPPDPSDPNPVLPDPADAPQIDISGSLGCDGTPTGTGMFETIAVETCAQLATHQGVFEQADTSGKVCAEVYGGPQHASIHGAVDGHAVDVSITRDDSCGIETWQSLEWLLGPPER